MVLPRKRPNELPGTITKVTTGCGSIYVTVTYDNEGLFEVFSTIGHTGNCGSAQTEAICRLVSLCLRSGIDANEVVKQLNGIRCPSQGIQDGVNILSCADAIAKVLKRKIEERNGKKKAK